ncbi:hypothetical protein [Rubritalea sp.]|uniref:hypothetical protein n=1 Tax=Rubritalea sp. TaxID=2109375 RepID=UPI003EF59A09
MDVIVNIDQVAPIPLSEGDVVKFVGRDERGLLRVWALQNESTGWVTEVVQSNGLMAGCLIAFIVIWVMIALAMTVFFASVLLPLAILPLGMAVFGVYFAYKSISSISQSKAVSEQAHTMLKRS